MLVWISAVNIGERGLSSLKLFLLSCAIQTRKDESFIIYVLKKEAELLQFFKFLRTSPIPTRDKVINNIIFKKNFEEKKFFLSLF